MDLGAYRCSSTQCLKRAARRPKASYIEGKEHFRRCLGQNCFLGKGPLITLDHTIIIGAGRVPSKGIVMAAITASQRQISGAASFSGRHTAFVRVAARHVHAHVPSRGPSRSLLLTPRAQAPEPRSAPALVDDSAGAQAASETVPPPEVPSEWRPRSSTCKATADVRVS